MPEISDILWGIWFAFIFAVIITVAVIIIRQLSRQMYIYFCVVNGESSIPVAHLKVYGIRPRFRGKKLLGRTDEKGEFRIKVGKFSYPALSIVGKDIQMGMIPSDRVSKEKSFPSQPIQCQLNYGCLITP